MIQYIYPAFMLMAVCATVLGLSSCDKDCPVCPPPPAEPVSDYDVYISGTYAHAVYVYNTASKAITDTIPLPGSYYTADIGVSGDGRHLLVLSTPGVDYNLTNLTIIDLEILDTIKTINGVFVDYLVGGIEVSNTGKYVAVYDDNNIYFYDGATFEVLFSDTIDILSGRFTYNDSLFYCQRGLTNYFIYDMAVESLVTKSQYVDESGYSPHIWAIQPTHDGSALFMFVAYPHTNYFISYRPKLDSTGIWYLMGPPGGDLRISPDGVTILASDPGFVELEEPGTQMLLAVDASNEVVTIIPPGYTHDGLFALLAGDIAFTYDSRYAMVADEDGWGFGLLDMKTLRYVDVQRSPVAEGTTSLAACQKIRK